MSPLVSIIMSVFNSERYLSDAIQSILNQTYTNYDFIIADDGSTDRSLSIILDYANKDSRIIVIENDQNVGLSTSLNKCLCIASGKYIARMDADDISLPDRIKKQVNFLELNSDIGLLGTCGFYIDENKKIIGEINVPLSNAAIGWRATFTNPFVHPSIMLRKTSLINFPNIYNGEYLLAEDYYLWVNLLKTTKGSNLSEKLYLYRIHNQSVSIQKKEKQKKTHLSISSKKFEENYPELINYREGFVLLSLLFRSGFKNLQNLKEKKGNLINTYLSIWELFPLKPLKNKDFEVVYDAIYYYLIIFIYTHHGLLTLYQLKKFLNMKQLFSLRFVFEMLIRLRRSRNNNFYR